MLSNNGSKFKAVVLGAALALASPLAANAQGFYVDIGVGQSKFDVEDTAGWNVDDTDTAYSIGAGYKFTDYIAIEGGYLDLGKVSMNTSGTISGTYYGSPISASGTINASAKADGWYLGPVLIWPVSDKFELYGRAGVYFWNVDATATASGTLTYGGATYVGSATGTASDDGNNAYYGIGAAYKATKNISVGADWTRYDIDGDDVDVLGARLKYAF